MRVFFNKVGKTISSAKFNNFLSLFNNFLREIFAAILNLISLSEHCFYKISGRFLIKSTFPEDDEFPPPAK